MRNDRRNVLNQIGFLTIAGATFGVTPTFSFALGQDEATAHVQLTINEVAALVDSKANTVEKASRLGEIMEQRAAMPQIARFVAGTAWRGMNEDQQARFVGAFKKFVSRVYASRFQEYASAGDSSESFKIGRVIDAGNKGLLVKTRILRAGGAPVDVEWLVSDRPGQVLIADIVIEGVSLLVTQRDEIGGMLDKRQGDVEKLITDLSA